MSKRIYNEWTEEEIEELIDVYKDFGYKSYRFFKRHTVNSTKDITYTLPILINKGEVKVLEQIIKYLEQEYLR